MGTRLYAIREACKLQPDDRTEEQVTDILDFVRDVKFFSELTSLQQRTLCRTMTIEAYPPRHTIFALGDIGNKYYIILSGSVSVQVPSPSAACPSGLPEHKDRCDCNNRPLDIATFLAKGMGFGELALQSCQSRTATIITGEPTEVLVTTAADYEKYAGKFHRLFIEQRVKFLRQCPLIETALQSNQISLQDLAGMADCLNEKSLHGHEIVVRQGEPVESMIFVKSGSLAMLRLVDLEAASARSSPRKGPMSTSGTPRSAGAKQRGKASPRRGKNKDDSSSSSSSSEEGESPRRRASGTGEEINLARAMIALKQQERDTKLVNMYINDRRKSREEATEITETLLGRRTSLTLVPADSPRPKDRIPSKERRSSSKDSRASASLGADSAGSGGEGSRPPSKGRALWAKLKKHTNKAIAVKALCSLPSSSRGSTRPATTPGRPFAAKTARTPNGKETKKKTLLRIGSVGAFQYVGDREVCNNQTFPCNLVSDPIAEIFTMSKHDILRRLPKNLLATLFINDTNDDPTDTQVLEMLRQSERWFSFRRGLHGEALMRRDQGRPLKATVSGSRVDAVANLAFLGLNPTGDLAKRILPPPRKKGTELTTQDQEQCSQSSARFLRRFHILKKDPGLQNALARVGAPRSLRTGLNDENVSDPMAVRFEQQWARMRKDPISLDLGEDLDDLSKLTFSGKATASASEPDSTAEVTASGVLDKRSPHGSGSWVPTITADLPPIQDLSPAPTPPRTAAGGLEASETSRRLPKVGFTA
eukprot:TRINITY_DN18652_c0_g2_i1.p1 TRINITY_DN18652_c0_g2~~TRINITY_DN18652_c0_g2_i1.p1  ORF type:complete len:764 (-),score=125.41 TRINITY_DN18652_c0_g2_i1:99-2390(-)